MRRWNFEVEDEENHTFSYTSYITTMILILIHFFNLLLNPTTIEDAEIIGDILLGIEKIRNNSS